MVQKTIHSVLDMCLCHNYSDFS